MLILVCVVLYSPVFILSVVCGTCLGIYCLLVYNASLPTAGIHTGRLGGGGGVGWGGREFVEPKNDKEGITAS